MAGIVGAKRGRGTTLPLSAALDGAQTHTAGNALFLRLACPHVATWPTPMSEASLTSTARLAK